MIDITGEIMINKNMAAYIILAGVICFGSIKANAGVQFKADFAPQNGLTAPQEKPYRDEICLNGRWLFQPVPLPENYTIAEGAPELSDPEDDKWEKTPIKIPSPWNVNSFSQGDGGDFRCFPSYPESWNKADMGWLKRSFNIPAAWKTKRIFLNFEAIAGDAQIFVNGKKAAQRFDIFTPLKVDITDLVTFNKPNILLVGVRKPSLFDIPGKFGRWTYPTGSFWGMHIVGIWQDVYLQAEPIIRIADAFIKPMVEKDSLLIDVSIKNHTAQNTKVSIKAAVYPMKKNTANDIISAPEPSLQMDKTPSVKFIPVNTSSQTEAESIITLRTQINGKLKLWTPDEPNLYGAIIEIIRGTDTIDRKFVRFGWRQFSISGKSLMLNGKPIQAKGDAWHFMGVPQMTRRYAWSWFKALKDANANAVRPHAQVYPRFYLDTADEMGIMVLDESAIWASHCGFNYDEPVTWERFTENAESMVLRDRNHPSVFGWSVANEINAALGVVKASAEQVAEIDDKIKSIVDRMYELDPTRPWISSDGDEDMNGRLKTAIGHYGGTDYNERLAELGKPFGIGEATSAYYGTPKEVSQFNGERAYESFEGRMEGLAIEAYDLIANGQRKEAAYCSVFNLAWYALKPLPIGLNDLKRPPELSDGIFFGRYKEGKPGMQPERLGPYCTTFNPGYDPSLPLYDTWAMFDAIKSAYAPIPEESPWSYRCIDEQQSSTQSTESIEDVGFVGDNRAGLSFSLIRSGIKLNENISSNTKLLIIDGKTITNEALSAVSDKITDILANGGTVMIWGLNNEKLPVINSILPYSISLNDRSAVSLTALPHKLTANMRLSDLYFAEQPFGQVILPQGMEGEFLENGKVIIEASNTDWRKWNGQGENIKTAAIIRSEREQKPSGAALIELASGNGNIIAANLDFTAATPKHTQIIRRLMGNMGVKLYEPASMQGGVFNASGTLQQALVIGSFEGKSDKDAFDTDYLNGENSTLLKPKLNDKVGDRVWQIKNSDEKQIMDFNKMGLPGPNLNCAAYISFWIYSPRPLDQLLAQPNVPRVDMIAGADDSMKLWLNGNVLTEEYATHPLNIEQHRLTGLPLKQGWNHFLVKVVQGWGEWQFAARIQCTDPVFLSEMRSSVESPD